MKKFLFIMAAIAALFTACSKDEKNWIDVDYSDALVGTWTCLEADYASALVFTADGKVLCSGVGGGEYWEDINGVFSSKNNNLSISFENGHKFDGRLDMVANKCISIANEDGTLHTYNYCANDLSDEVVGMWVCNDSPNTQKNDIAIISYFENGTSTFTGMIPNAESYMVTVNSSYKVVGDLLFQKSAEKNSTLYLAMRLVYTPNGTSYGDILTQKMYATVENTRVETTMTYLRIKQSLDLAGQKYDYNNVYVSNVKGDDKDIEFFNTTLNFAKLDSSTIDKFLNATIFSVMFPDANTIKYSFLEEQHTTLQAPIVVEGNKMTIKMSANKAAYQDVVVYAFQDADDSQLHIYMPTASFESFFANAEIQQMEEAGLIDINDAAAVAEIHNNVKSLIDTINVSLIFKAAK